MARRRIRFGIQLAPVAESHANLRRRWNLVNRRLPEHGNDFRCQTDNFVLWRPRHGLERGGSRIQAKCDEKWKAELHFDWIPRALLLRQRFAYKFKVLSAD